MTLEIGISEESREAVARMLNDTLADEYVLYTKTRNYHWNVFGPLFNDLHKFFEAQYEELNEIVDEVAERVRTLGGWSRATLMEFTSSTRLKEHPGEYPSAEDMLSGLLADHEALIRTLRNDQEACAETYGDMGTNDFLIGLMERHEKMAWMIRATLESHPGPIRTGPPASVMEEEPAKTETKRPRTPKGASRSGTRGGRKKRTPTPKPPEEGQESDETVIMEDESHEEAEGAEPSDERTSSPGEDSGGEKSAPPEEDTE